jgi:hypothetical protein
MTICIMRFACWITKDTHEISEYVIVIAFVLQQGLHERVSILQYTYTACLVALKRSGNRDWPIQSKHKNEFCICNLGGRDSSVGIATGYGLDGPGIESWWGARFFAHVQTGPGGPPSLLYNGYWVFPGGKAAGA